MLAHLLRRNWEVLLLLLIGLFQYASGHALGSASRVGSDYFLIAVLVAALAHFHQHIVPVLLPLWLVIIGYCIAVPSWRQLRRSCLDALAVFAMVKVESLFVLLNLLILFPSQDHVLPILQLLLFLPCLVLVWGWIYWRMDDNAASTTGQRMFLFRMSADHSPGLYDYFLASLTSMISTTLGGFTGETRTARTLIFLHGLMMWDVMGLTLSRAIAIASQ